MLTVAEKNDAAVPELALANLGTTPVLLLEGEQLVGAKQRAQVPEPLRPIEPLE